MTGRASAPSLFGVLQKAQPRWSLADVCRVQEKLNKMNVNDVQSLGKAVMEGYLNAQLSALGERRLKPSTLAQLKIQVRRPYRAAQLSQETISTTASRSCFCGKCVVGSLAACSSRAVAPSALSERDAPSSMSSALLHPSSSSTAAPASQASPPSLSGARSVGSLRQAGERILASDPASPSSAAQSSRALEKSRSEPHLRRQVVRIEPGEATLTDSFVSSKPRRTATGAGSLAASHVPAVKSRSGALNLPQVPGGMRHDDDALEGLLRVAQSHLKRGTWKESARNPGAIDASFAEAGADDNSDYANWLESNSSPEDPSNMANMHFSEFAQAQLGAGSPSCSEPDSPDVASFAAHADGYHFGGAAVPVAAMSHSRKAADTGSVASSIRRPGDQVAKSSRRRRWINAYDAGGLHCYRARAAVPKPGVSGASSLATSGTCASRRS